MYSKIAFASSTRPGEGEPLCRGAAGCLRGRADLSGGRRAGEHVLRAQVPETVPPRDRDQTLVAEIYEAREGYRSVYGVRKTWKELKRRDVEIGRDRVARLMRQERLEGSDDAGAAGAGAQQGAGRAACGVVRIRSTGHRIPRRDRSRGHSDRCWPVGRPHSDCRGDGNTA